MAITLLCPGRAQRRRWTHVPDAVRSAFGVVLIALLLLTSETGCSAMNDSAQQTSRFHEQQSSASGKAEVGQWAGHGSVLTEAVERLRSKGFQCQPSQPQVPSVKAAYYCSLQTPAPPPTDPLVTAPPAPVFWTVTLESEDGVRVHKLDVVRTPPHLGD